MQFKISAPCYLSTSCSIKNSVMSSNKVILSYFTRIQTLMSPLLRAPILIVICFLPLHSVSISLKHCSLIITLFKSISFQILFPKALYQTYLKTLECVTLFFQRIVTHYRNWNNLNWTLTAVAHVTLFEAVMRIH